MLKSFETGKYNKDWEVDQTYNPSSFTTDDKGEIDITDDFLMVITG